MTAPSAWEELPLRPELRARTAYGAPQIEVPVRLNTNENSHPVPPEVVATLSAEITRIAPELNRYPDREFTELRTALAEYLKVTADHIWAANGSNEILLHLLLAFAGPGRTVLGFTPGYAMHPIISETSGATWVEGFRGEADFALSADAVLAQIADHRPSVIFLCSPNNPTGTAMQLDLIEKVYAASDGALLIVDEAYAEFARTAANSALSLLPGRPRLVVTRTMSKAFAFAGVRLGYLAADPAVTQALRLVRLPYHLSSLTQAAALAGLHHTELMLSTVAEIRAQRDRMVTSLVELGLNPVPSDANFVLVGGFTDAQQIWQQLLDRGILVRDVGIAHHLRVTAGTAAETSAFLSALADILGA